MSHKHHTHTPYRALISWLEQSPIKILSPEQYQALFDLSQLLESGYISNNSNLQAIIEVHHDGSGLVDFSTYCDQELSILTGIGQPECIRQWLLKVKLRGLDDAFPKEYWLEFDCNKSGYRLMGLFQRCNLAALDLTTLLDLIKPKLSRDGFLATTLTSIGMPAQLGLLNRAQDDIKVVIPIQEPFREPLLELTSNWFSAQLSNAGLSFDSLADALQEWRGVYLVALSIDCNLSQDKPGQRLCFEFIDPHGPCTDVHSSHLHELFERLRVPTDQLRQFRRLRNQLPYGIRRLNFNVVDQEYLYLVPAHSKVCFSLDGVSLKDYIRLGAKRASLNA